MFRGKTVSGSRKILSQKVDSMRGERREHYVEEAEEISGILVIFYILIQVVDTQIVAL